MSIRSFIGIELTDEARAALAEEQNRLRDALAGRDGIAWVKPESLHLTLKFLGNAEERALTDLGGALASQLTTSPMAVDVSGVGAFPSLHRAKVLWAGVTSGGDGSTGGRLAELAAEVDVIAGELGFAREDQPDRAFRAHVTLARVRRVDLDVEAAMSEARSRVFGSMTITAITVFESRPASDGSIYIPRARIPLPDRVDAGPEQRSGSGAPQEGDRHGT